MTQWKTPKRKKSKVTDSFLYEDEAHQPPTEPCEEILSKDKAHQNTPSTWKGKNFRVTGFVKRFFENSNPPHPEDESVSLRVLGI